MTEQESDGGTGTRLDLNKATAEQLETLPGIGPAYAGAIVLAREQDGPFSGPDALVQRGIIPERILDGIRTSISTGGSPPAEGRPGGRAASAAAGRPSGGVRRAIRRYRRSLRGRRARVGYAVAATVLAIAAFPILTFLSSFNEGVRAQERAGIVSDATFPPPPASSGSATETATATATNSPTAAASAVPTAIPLPDSPVRYIGNTDGDGVGLRTACEDEARTDGAWAEGAEVVIEERGTGACFTWSHVSRGKTSSWVRNVYLVEQSPVAIVTGTSASLPNPGFSRAQEHCIQYRLGGSYFAVCRTFPTLERALWTPWDLGTYGHLSYQRLQFFSDCYVNNPRVGSPLDRCAFTRLNP